MQLIQRYLFEFYGSTIPLYWMDDRRMYLPLVDLCRAIGISVRPQRRRLQENPALFDAYILAEIEIPYGDSGAVRNEEIICLWIERFHYWLGTIDSIRVPNPEIRQRLILYQREAADMLWAMFRSDMFPPEVLAEMDTHLPIQRQNFLRAVDELAELRQELGLVGGQLSGVGQRLDGLEGRMQSIEAKFVGEPLGPQQQAHLKEMISAVAMAFYETTQGHAKGKGGCFSLTWHDFYRQFHIANYPELPAARMAEAVQYLAGQYRFYAGAGLPEVFRRGDQQRMI